MECYEGATMIKTFRGRLLDGTQDTILLHTNDGSTGYRIVKFQIMPQSPGGAEYESGVSIWKKSQSTISTSALDFNFADNDLLAAAYTLVGAGSTQGNNSEAVIFDKEIVNQDIYITHTNIEGSGAAGNMNYYIELEQIKLDLSENTVATLKNIRNELRIPPG